MHQNQQCASDLDSWAWFSNPLVRRLSLVRVRLFVIISIYVKLGEEASDILPPESPVTATADTVCPYYPPLAPPSHCIAMDIKK
jgi:hypothetical protein